MIEYDNEKEYNEVCGKLEPMPNIPLSDNDDHALRTTALVSIAISLKRIADKLELSQKQPIVMSAEEYAKYESQKNDQK